MAVDPRQFLLLAIALAVPVVAFFLDRSRLVLAWIGFTLSVQIFDTTILTNLPAGRLIGLLFLPSTIGTIRRWGKLPPARAWLVNLLYMVLLGVIFGFLFPWPDISGTRPFGVRAQGRTIIFLTRTLADLSLTVFVMAQLARPGAFDTLRKWMIRGAAVSASFGLLTLVTRVDFYTLITGLRAYAAADFRPRGLAFEARGLGLACAYGLILVLTKHKRTGRDWFLLMIIAAGLTVSSSSSALAAALAGLLVIAVIGSARIRMAMIASLALLAVLLTGIVVYAPEMAQQSRYAVESRLKGRGVVESNNARNAAEAIAYRMDVFDSAASLFLMRNPLYAVIGTGPGLISLPASEHVPDGLYRMVFPIIDNPPSHGILLELANTGILGVGVFFFQVLSVFIAGRSLRGRRGLPFQPISATSTFVVGATLYALQVSPSPFWAVFLGIGWAVAEVAAEVRAPNRAPAGARQRLTPVASTAAAGESYQS